MREMKDSGVPWIGKIPEAWTTVKTKYNVSIQNGSDPILEGDIPVYGSGKSIVKTCGEFKIGPATLLGRKGTLGSVRYIDVGKNTGMLIQHLMQSLLVMIWNQHFIIFVVFFTMLKRI